MYRKIKGFSLLEVTIALIIATALIAIMVPILRDEGDARRTDALVNQHAREYKMLYDAASKWAAENGDSMAGSTTVSVAISDLITSGYLPAGFAKRTTAGAVGEALLGGAYAMYARKDDLSASGGNVDHVRILITETGIFRPPLARKSGISASTGTTEYKDQSNAYVNRLLTVGQNEYKLVGGLLKASTTDGIGLKGAFTQPISQFITAESDAGRPAIFWGFPGINPDGSGTGGSSGNIPGQCNIVFPYYKGTTDAVCDAGWTEIASWAPCWPQLPTIVGVPAIGAALTVGTISGTNRDMSGFNRCSYQNSPHIPYYCLTNAGDDLLYNVEVYRTFTINNAVVGTMTCGGSFWHDTNYPWESRARPHGHYQVYGSTANVVFTHINDPRICDSYDPITDNRACLTGGISDALSLYNAQYSATDANYTRAKICCRD